ncbi:MAG: ATP-binding protein [Saprospiraceae bacterium]
MLYKRLITNQIQGNISKVPISIILGPRQVGKSTLVKDLIQYNGKHIYLDLELPSDEMRLSDAETYLTRNIDQTIVIDEIQRKPELFPLLRAIVDKYKTSSLILLGSASEDIIMKSTESLAGRSAYYEMQPLTLWEVGTEKLYELWLKGGFPKAFITGSYADSIKWLNQFIKSYIERELSLSYLKASPLALEKFLTLITSVHGQLSNYSMIGASMDLSVPTVKRYIDFFEQKYILRVIQPYFVNIGKRLTKSPKIYFRDSGILHSMRGIESEDQLEGDILKGASWEGFVIQQIISLLSINVKYYFYRTSDGTELDLILLKGTVIKLGIEIKYSNSPKLSPAIGNIISDLKIPQVIVVTPSSEEYQLKEKILISPLKNIMNHLRANGLTAY